MKLRNAFLSLWHATHGPTRWVILVFYVLMGFLAISVAQFSHEADWTSAVAVILGMGTAFWWALFPPKTLVLAIDARQLRLPGIQRGIIVGLLLLGLLTIALPAAVVGLCGGDASLLAIELALFAMGGFTFALLPRYLSIMAAFSPLLLHSLQPYLDLPSPSDPRFASWAGLAILALFQISILCWRRQLYADNPYARGFSLSTPMALQFSNRGMGGLWNARSGFFGAREQNSAQSIRQRPPWMRLQVNMRKVGPSHPVGTLRVALGGMFVPLTLIGRVQQLALLLVPSLLFVVLFAMVMTTNVADKTKSHELARALFGGGMAFVTWFGTFFCLMFAILTTGYLERSWRRVNAELPLLALLPGLKGAGTLRRSLLLATLLPPLRSQSVLLVLLIVAAINLPGGGVTELFIALAPLGSAGMVVAVTLCILGGQPLSYWVTAGLMVVTGILIFINDSTVPALMNTGEHPWDAGDIVLFALGMAWLLLAAVLLWLGRRGWRGLQQRPHPFLPN